MKKALFLAIVTILVTHTHTAYAFTYDRTPTGTEIQNPVTLSITFSDLCGGSEFANTCGSDVNYWGFYIDDYLTGEGKIQGCYASTTLSGEETYTNLPVDDYRFVMLIGWENIGDCGDVNLSTWESGWTSGPNPLEGGTGSFDVAFSVVAGSSNATWGSNNGFWGDVTTSDIKDSLQASVQATGFNIWPLFAFVGVALAFGIAGLVVYQIRQSVAVNTGNKKEIVNPGGSDFIYHSAEDLEFKRNYGSEEPVKRKRGRPRKTPL